MHICKKNKFIHEDIKAVCNSATKKLIACGLVVAVNGGNIVNAQTREFDAQKQLKKELQVEESTAVSSVSNTANSQGNTVEQLSAARTSGPVASSTPVTQQMTPAQDQPANSFPNVASELTTEVNAANNSGEGVTSNYSAEDFAKDAEELMALMQARLAEIEKDFEELKPKAEKKISSELARYEHNPEDGEWKFKHDNYLNIDDASVQRLCNLPKEIKNAARHAYALRHRLDYLRERIKDYNARLGRGVTSLVTYSRRYRQVKPQTDEPSRYDIEQAPAYVEWATNEVKRLEQLARDLQQQLHLDEQEQTDFENILCWFDPAYAVLQVMAEEDSLDTFFELSRQTDGLKIEINQQTEQIRQNKEELAEMQQNLHRIMEENLAFFSQPYEPPFNNNQVQNDNNMINNNQIDIDDSITITREEFERNIPGNQLRGEGILVERPEHNNQIDDCQMQNDNNMINNNQIEEIQDVTNEQDNNNLINNNQQQQPILHIAPLNVPTPQQRNGFLGGTLNFIGNTLSFFNPFNK